MNILFFLKPKVEIAYLCDDYTIRQSLEKMEFHRYTSVPIIDKKGRYVGTITEGDLLWFIKNNGSLNLKAVEELPVTTVVRKQDNRPISVNAKMEDLITNAIEQNFVPVIDDDKIFIGIVTRKEIINYLYGKQKKISNKDK